VEGENRGENITEGVVTKLICHNVKLSGSGTSPLKHPAARSFLLLARPESASPRTYLEAQTVLDSPGNLLCSHGSSSSVPGTF
jgi:hypothetical protein